MSFLARLTVFLAALSAVSLGVAADGLPQLSGIYPHLAMFNDESECGTGAVVVWADRLWAVTYAPHAPMGSSDKLYEITPQLGQIPRPESVGGTPANRMVHRESGQLFIGRYAIDGGRNVRVLPHARMPGRLTGTARHLTTPAEKVYFATMEEGLYEVDVRTLEVTGLIRDGNNVGPENLDEARPAAAGSTLPGYHGKGLYTGHGRLVYANNGEHGARALRDPTTPSGALAEWTGTGDWQLVRRNQFTEVTGPGGITGASDPDTDPIWTVGWDVRSVLLLVRMPDSGWHPYRLPKGSHSYDGAHGWNTEWPRIREVGEGERLLMTMHGTFWAFPRSFAPGRAAGVAPRSNYLKVVGDFCRWGDRIVFGCDDAAKSEFLNKRKAKGAIAGPGKSHSNLWFVKPETLDALGPLIGRGGVWVRDPVEAGRPSDPFLFAGYEHRAAFLVNGGGAPVRFAFEIDRDGTGTWARLGDEIEVPPWGSAWHGFGEDEAGEWVRVVAGSDCPAATAFFHFWDRDRRPSGPDAIFDGVAPPGVPATGGLLHARGAEFRTLRLVTGDAVFDMGADLRLHRADDLAGREWTSEAVALPQDVIEIDAASVLYTDDAGRRWRLPVGDRALAAQIDKARVSREIVTERDLFNIGGTFFELPAENAGGMAMVRPVCTHNRAVVDYASYRGLTVMTGIEVGAGAENPHIIRSPDAAAALWAGVADDLWRMGKPRGTGGPWMESGVGAGIASDPYLMTGYERKRVSLHHRADTPVTITLEVDVTGDGLWVRYTDFRVPPGETAEHLFPDAFAAYWVRAVADDDCVATVVFAYE